MLGSFLYSTKWTHRKLARSLLVQTCWACTMYSCEHALWKHTRADQKREKFSLSLIHFCFYLFPKNIKWSSYEWINPIQACNFRNEEVLWFIALHQAECHICCIPCFLWDLFEDYWSWERFVNWMLKKTNYHWYWKQIQLAVFVILLTNSSMYCEKQLEVWKIVPFVWSDRIKICTDFVWYP